MRPNMKRPSREPTAAEYEAAIQRTEQSFARNKSRLWVMKVLRDFIVEQVDGPAVD